MTTRLTLEEYRAMEEPNPERYEYCSGEIITMPSGSETHSAIVLSNGGIAPIASNFLIHLGFLLRAA
ncbi:MAG: Uma2 family endonuclease [Rhizonema sp. PD37]|nr:Uma2 family endonuclease [Rhizonema sp. PD37]